MIYHPECFFRDDITDLVVFTTLVSVFMLMADGTGGDQLTTEIGFHRRLSFALDTDNDLHATLVENVYSTAAHAAGNNDLCAVVCQKVGQEAGAMTGIGNGIDCNDLVVGGVKEDEVFTMAKMSGHLSSLAATAIFIVIVSFY